MGWQVPSQVGLWEHRSPFLTWCGCGTHASLASRKQPVYLLDPSLHRVYFQSSLATTIPLASLKQNPQRITHCLPSIWLYNIGPMKAPCSIFVSKLLAYCVKKKSTEEGASFELLKWSVCSRKNEGVSLLDY